MRFLRTVSTQRLLAIVAGVILAVAGGTAIAVAASGGGPVPPRESLATALHQAASAPTVRGITARITFTNHLIDATAIQGNAGPLLGGASGRLWMSPATNQMRLELQGESGDAQVVVSGGAFSIYDPTSNTLYKGTLPSQGSSTQKSEPIPTVAQIQSTLNQLLQHVNLVGPLPRNVAGQPAYKVVVSPKHDGGLLGDVQLAWDASRGIPLGIAIYSRNSSSPVLELKATDISYGPVSTGDLKVKAPGGAKTVQVSPTADRSHARTKSGKHQADVTGPVAVQSHLPFTLAAPAKLAGLPRQSVQLLDWSGQPAALVTYGQGLGGIVVIEQSASGQSASSAPQGGEHQGLSLPTVSINGHSGQELATALGTVVRFTSGPVSYTVLGSVPPIAAESAARQLAP
jgi:hypothetical protein